jgi:hypothetical protein
MTRGRGQGLMAMQADRVYQLIEQAGPLMPGAIRAATGIKLGYLSDILAHLVHRGDLYRGAAGYQMLQHRHRTSSLY